MDMTTISTPPSPNPPSSSNNQWWDIIGPIIAFLFIFIILASCCKCILQSCGNCWPFSSRQNEHDLEQRVGNDNSVFNADEDLPPSYSVTRLSPDPEMFRVAVVSESSESRRTSTAVSEKLPSYAEIVEEKRQKEEHHHAANESTQTLHVVEAASSPDVITDVVTPPHVIVDDLEQSSSDEDTPPPPPYTRSEQ